LGLVPRSFLLLLTVAIASLPAMAQGGKGIITGRATDASGAILQGAQVGLQQSTATMVTDRQGEFTFTDLAPGSYTVTISYVGFSPFSGSVTVAAGQAAHMEAVLTVASKGEEIVVTADRPHGEAEAINRERASDNILNVLPSGVIRSLPNANIADAVGRLPSVTLERDEGEGKYVQIRGTEPRLNNLTVDGITIPAPEAAVRQVKLDTIPADIVEAVEINKTLSANQDADAIGGSVNLVTKTAGELPTLTLEGLGGFTPIVNTRYVGQVDGTVGQRFGANKKLGILFGASYDYNGRGIDDIEPSPDPSYVIPYYDSMDLREYRYKRTRYGFGGSVDYKLKEASGLFFHYLYSDFKDYGDKWTYTLNDGDVPKFKTSSRLPDYMIGLFAIGGKHEFTTSWLSWEVSAARSRQGAAAGNPGVDFKYSGSTICNYDQAATINPHLPQFDPACTAPGSPIFDPSLYYIKEYDTTSGNTSQVNLQGSVSMAKNYHLGSHFSIFEFGGQVRNGHKGQDAFSGVYDNVGNLPSTGNPPTMNMFVSGFTNPSYYFGAYRIGPVTDYNKLTAFFNANPQIFPLDWPATQFQSASSNYDLTERVSAAYAMNTIEFGRLRLQAGLRVEATQLNILGYVVTNTTDSNGNPLVITTPKPSNFWYWNPLPSVQLRYALTPDSDIRAVYGRGISRPNPYDLVPYVTEDQTTNPYTVAVGNPNLRPEHANNYDLLYEQYLKPYGKIQGGFFYKQLSSPIYYIVDPAYEGPQYPQYKGDQFSYIINGQNAQLWGLEVAYIQHLGFLPGFLSGFGISANYSWTTSNAGHLPLRPDTPALQRQAPTTWNLSPTYDRGRLSARLGVTYNGASIYAYQWTQCTPTEAQGAGCEDPANLGPKGPVGDIYFYPHLQVDAQVSYRVQKSLTALVQFLNLSNDVFGFYNGSPNYTIQREYYKPTYSFGLRWQPRREE
jgi:outer membrane receptor protein involved in Fe transport